MNREAATVTDYVRGTAVLGFLAQSLFAPKLWLWGTRSFPALPVLGEGYEVDFDSGWLLYSAPLALILFVTTIAMLPHWSRAFPARLWLAVIAVYCLLDLTCLQPWVWFYALIIAGVQIRAVAGEITAIRTLRWVVIAVYVWGGFNKLTPYYAEDNWPWLAEAFGWLKPLGAYPALGYASAVFEALLGLALAWPRSRRAARWVVLAFHLFVVAALSPLGLHWNTVVIPWNLALAAIVFLLFSDREPLRVQRHTASILLVAATGVLPVLNIVGYWPHNLSWQLYSNTQPEGTFLGRGVTDDSHALYPAFRSDASGDDQKLFFDEWAMTDLGVPPYAGSRAFRRLGRHLCRVTSPSDSSGLYLLTVDRWDRTRERFDWIPCAELQNEK
jgi:hypothetical protein